MTKEQKLTVGEIAECIREPSEDLTVVVDRLRNWTGEGLLKTLDHNPGTGRKRLYPEKALVDAAVLNALTSVVNMPAVIAGRMRVISTDSEKTAPLLQVARRAFDEFEERERAGEWCWFGLHRHRVREALKTSGILYYTKNTYDPPDSRRVADLKRSFEDVRIPNWSEASIVLNLTKLFRHLQNRRGEINGNHSKT